MLCSNTQLKINEQEIHCCQKIDEQEMHALLPELEIGEQEMHALLPDDRIGLFQNV